jgi:hypothetical protein
MIGSGAIGGARLVAMWWRGLLLTASSVGFVYLLLLINMRPIKLAARHIYRT